MLKYKNANKNIKSIDLWCNDQIDESLLEVSILELFNFFFHQKQKLANMNIEVIPSHMDCGCEPHLFKNYEKNICFRTSWLMYVGKKASSNMNYY